MSATGNAAATAAPAPAALVEELRRICGAQHVLDQPVDLITYGYDCSFWGRMEPHEPAVVVRPGSAEEVGRVVAAAARSGLPVTARGAGTGQAGAAIPVRGGIVLDLLRLDRILEYDLDNLQIIVEPGKVHAALNEELKAHGFFFPPDPGSSKMATIGGMVANNSSGMRSVKYGTTRNYVLGLEVVLPDGTLTWTGGLRSRALKSVSGYDLTQLLVGSEGTLAVITKIRLKVLPLPERRGVVMAVFDELEAAGRTVQATFRAGVIPSAIEILDRTAVAAVNALRPEANLPDCEAILLFEVDGSPPGVAHEAARIAEICKREAREATWTDDPAQIGRVWQARQLVGAAAARLKAGTSRVYDGEDIAVPMARVPEALRTIQRISAELGIAIVTYGHVGDGNMHAAVIVDFRSEAELEKARAAAEQIHRMALRLGGTVTAEHGVGLSRARYMEEEHGPALEVMRRIKRAFDPDGLLNPGKMGL